jgi:flagellar assembly protein FliH
LLFHEVVKMQSLYNVIKVNNVIPLGRKEIQTEFIMPQRIRAAHEPIRNDAANEICADYESLKAKIESYEALARKMIENARRESEGLISKAYEEARKIEKDAYHKGYNEGTEAGYREAYEQTLPQSITEAEAIINNANSVLFDAKLQYETYMENRKDEILNLAIAMSEQILKRELKSKDGLNELVYEAVKASRNAETFIIRTSKQYIEEIKEKLQNWKESLGLKGEVFVVGDDSITEGNAIIEKNNGKIEVGIDAGLNNIRQELF